MRMSLVMLWCATAYSLSMASAPERVAADPKLAAPAAAPKPPRPRPSPAVRGPRLLVVGTFHMESDGSDMLQVTAPDVTTPARQREIDELVALLARFRPTKIAVERPFGSTATREHYRRYLAGDDPLTRNEVDQLGFRLAKAMKHAD